MHFCRDKIWNGQNDKEGDSFMGLKPLKEKARYITHPSDKRCDTLYHTPR